MNITEFQTWLDTTLTNHWWREGLILGAGVLIIGLLRLILFPVLRRVAGRTDSNLDDNILGRIQPTLFTTVFFVALQFALVDLLADPKFDHWVRGAVGTWLVLIWGRAILDIGAIIFEKISHEADRLPWIQPQTLPLIKFVFKVIVFATQAWLILSTWNVNLTSWLASAGVVGIAVGFAAKDTLANFISGVFILVDSPYEVGQYIVIDGVTRGMVTDIGMRSTRILTRDNVEVTVPNAVIGNAKIINESSGPSPLMRVRVNVSVAYGSDVEEVKEVLMSCCHEVPHASNAKEPSVRFTAMGASSVDFQVRVWVEEPEFRGRVVDTLNTRIYKALLEAGIGIPFPQQDVHIKAWPSAPIAGDK
ncbi:MAG: mechanosensitive ion channel [Gemmatimonadales bacterium]|nr:mechanosensitive ion channel [Gemmatimonadales bacterium]